MALTQKEISDNFRKRRKEQGICLKCGKKLDREGINCIECNNKLNEEYKKTKQAYIQSGICYRCRINPIMGSEKQCPECRAKYREWKSMRPEAQKEIERELTRISHERIRQHCRDNGICYICKKRKVEPGRKRCSICKVKTNKYNREYNLKKADRLTKEQKIDLGICIWCDQKVVDGKKLCSTHYNKALNNLAGKRTPNENWRRQDQLIFKKGAGL